MAAACEVRLNEAVLERKNCSTGFIGSSRSLGEGHDEKLGIQREVARP
jgi:hypothetical protein